VTFVEIKVIFLLYDSYELISLYLTIKKVIIQII